MKVYKLKCEGCNPSVINGQACHEQFCSGTLTFSYRQKEFGEWRIFSLDVLGNIKNGFEVNDRRDKGNVKLPKEFSTRDVIEALKKKELINKKCHTYSFVDSADDINSIYIDAKKTGEPLFQLEKQ